MYKPVSNKFLSDILPRSGKHDALDEAFLLRFSANFQDIFNLYHTLYPLLDDLWQYLEVLVNTMIERYLDRSKELPALADSEEFHLVDCHNQHLLAYVRGHGEDRIFIVSNLNDHPERLQLDMMHYLNFDLKNGQDVKDLITDQYLAFNNGHYQLLPYQFVWITQV